jgi:hypothetical protein
MIHFIADVHLGNHRQHSGPVECGVNTRCREGLEVLQRVVNTCGDEPLVILGDLLDNTRPRPQLLAELQAILGSSSRSTLVLVGNHEIVSTTPGDHALGPLDAEYGVHVVDRPCTWGVDDATLLMVPYGVELQRLPEIVHEMCASLATGKPRALCGHFGIVDANTPPYLRDDPDAVELDVLLRLCEQHSISKVFAGHWHKARTWQHVYQVGALMSADWRDPGFRGLGRQLMWHARSGVGEQYFAGPRFVNVATAGELEELATDAGIADCVIRARWTVPAEAMEACRAQAAVIMRSAKNNIAAVEVLPAAQQGAVAEAQADAVANTDTAISDYVAGMSLPKGMQPTAVVAKTKQYLGGK